MSNALEALPFCPAWHHRLAEVLALQGWNTRRLTGSHHSFAFLGHIGGLAIEGVDVPNLLVKLVIADWRQPIVPLVRSEIAISWIASAH